MKQIDKIGQRVNDKTEQKLGSPSNCWSTGLAEYKKTKAGDQNRSVASDLGVSLSQGAKKE